MKRQSSDLIGAFERGLIQGFDIAEKVLNSHIASVQQTLCQGVEHEGVV